jgi:hypothetical protein
MPWHERVFQAIAFDEAHMVSNRSTLRRAACDTLVAHSRTVMTGTPIQNMLSELHSLVSLMLPHDVTSVLGDEATFNANYAEPFKAILRSTEVDHSALVSARGKLQAELAPIMIQRTKKGSMADYFASRQKFDLVVLVGLSEYQTRAYDSLLNNSNVAGLRDYMKKHNLTKSTAEVRSAVMTIGMRLFQMCSSHFLVKMGVAKADLAAYKKEMKNEQLGRGKAGDPFNVDFMTKGPKLPALPSVDEIIRSSAKHAFLARIMTLRHAQRRKTVIFTCSTVTMKMIGKVLAARGMKFLTISGSVSPTKRHEICVEFNKPEYNYAAVIVITSAGATGIDLIAADAAVIFEPSWNPKLDEQAANRVWRIGREGHVRIYRLISPGTIEELRYKRQIHKSMIANAALKKSDIVSLFDVNDIAAFITHEDHTRCKTKVILDCFHSASASSPLFDEEQRQIEAMDGVIGVINHDYINAADLKPIKDLGAALAEFEDQCGDVIQKSLDSASGFEDRLFGGDDKGTEDDDSEGSLIGESDMSDSDSEGDHIASDSESESEESESESDFDSDDVSDDEDVGKHSARIKAASDRRRQREKAAGKKKKKTPGNNRKKRKTQHTPPDQHRIDIMFSQSPPLPPMRLSPQQQPQPQKPSFRDIANMLDVSPHQLMPMDQQPQPQVVVLAPVSPPQTPQQQQPPRPPQQQPQQLPPPKKRTVDASLEQYVRPESRAPQTDDSDVTLVSEENVLVPRLLLATMKQGWEETAEKCTKLANYMAKVLERDDLAIGKSFLEQMAAAVTQPIMQNPIPPSVPVPKRPSEQPLQLTAAPVHKEAQEAKPKDVPERPAQPSKADADASQDLDFLGRVTGNMSGMLMRQKKRDKELARIEVTRKRKAEVKKAKADEKRAVATKRKEQALLAKKIREDARKRSGSRPKQTLKRRYSRYEEMSSEEDEEEEEEEEFGSEDAMSDSEESQEEEEESDIDLDDEIIKIKTTGRARSSHSKGKGKSTAKERGQKRNSRKSARGMDFDDV